jgi:predicted transcriptional regulator
VIYAKELASRLVEEGISQAELARRLGVSRARVSQWLGLLELPEEALREVEDLGDYWNRRMITERELRVLRRADPATGGQPS